MGREFDALRKAVKHNAMQLLYRYKGSKNLFTLEETLRFKL